MRRDAVGARFDCEVRRSYGIEVDQGRRYSWGYPACPEQSEHEKVWRLLGLEEIGMKLSTGWAVEPEQSTVAIVAHHPQAVYFGMKSGFIPAEPKGDELIAGTERGGDARPVDEQPEDGAAEDERERLPAAMGARGRRRGLSRRGPSGWLHARPPPAPRPHGATARRW